MQLETTAVDNTVKDHWVCLVLRLYNVLKHQKLPSEASFTVRELSALSNQAQALQQAVTQNMTVVVPWRWQQVTAWSTAAYMTSSAPLQEPCVPWPAAPLLHVARPPSIGMNAARPPSVNATNPPSVGTGDERREPTARHCQPPRRSSCHQATCCPWGWTQ